MPANIPEVAERLIPLARQLSDERLDFHPGSVRRADLLLGDLAAEAAQAGATVDDMFDTVFSFGAYLGETIRRAWGGQWVDAAGTPAAAVLSGPVLQLPDGRLCDPVGRCFRRARDGRDADLRAFYQVFSAPRDDGAPGNGAPPQ